MSQQPPRDTKPRAEKEFVALWEQHQRKLFLLCLRLMGGHRADAEDALGNAALCAFRNLPPSQALANPKGWLAQVARNACLDLLRARTREWRSRAETQDTSAPSELERLRDTRPNPEDHCLQRESVVWLGRALRTLPPHLRKPLLQRARAVPYSRMAQQSPVTEVNLRRRVREAKRLLRGCLECALTGGR
ncbi:RNA polymerase sigma factor [Corallococcus exercitus]|uniref:RNA polymerase sigma factor n=1 Tax=Corallococcus exercitus TaxID=2316736 RepID=UPI00234323D7|nr:RNA polymerase sigma factor [Corallococcus exercitus]